MIRRFVPPCALIGALALQACTYGIVLDAGGQGVRTDWNGRHTAACRDVGKVTVSVLSRVGPIDRNDIKVRDELEVMARNQASQMHADTIVPLGDPHDGEQAWEGYACGRVAPAYSNAPAYPSPPGSGAPVEEVPDNGPPPTDERAAPNYPPPPSNYPPPPRNAEPQPFGAPLPAGSAAQTYPAGGSSS